MGESFTPILLLGAQWIVYMWWALVSWYCTDCKFFFNVCVRFKMWFPSPAVTQQDPSYYWAAIMAPSTT